MKEITVKLLMVIKQNSSYTTACGHAIRFRFTVQFWKIISMSLKMAEANQGPLTKCILPKSSSSNFCNILSLYYLAG